MKRFPLLILVGLSLLSAGCADSGGVDPYFDGQGPVLSHTEQARVYEAWRVDMIMTSDMSNDMLAEYSYDESNRLVRVNFANRSKGDRIIDTNSETLFDWNNGLVARHHGYSRYQDHAFGYDHLNNFETLYEYNSEGRLLPWDNDNWPGQRQYEYDELGRLVQTYSYEFEGMTYEDRLEWDDNGNVIKHILAGPQLDSDIGFGYGRRLPGSYKETVFEYEYDNNPKPNFGLGEAFFWDGRFNPWPVAGTTLDQMARTLSRNNLTLSEMSGRAWRYTYNDEGLPETVQTIWIGIETLEPMVQTIHYKKLISD